MTDYKQLCAELLAALESWSPNGGAPLEEGAEAIAEARLIERARAADLLAQRHPQPVPLSERPWEREGWCDDQGRCWALNEHLPAWEFHDCADSRKWADLFLPAHALPLPSEVNK